MSASGPPPTTTDENEARACPEGVRGNRPADGAPGSPPRGDLLLFAREPRAGGVKTRLAASTGAQAASRLYAAFLADLAEKLEPAPGLRTVLVHAEDEPGPLLSSLFEAGWVRWAQGPGSLGDRLARAFLRSAEEGSPVAVAAGSDVPLLRRGDVEAALDAVGAGAAVVLAPSPDGGFGLLGVRAGVPVAALLQAVRWSTPDAAADVVAAARGLGLPVARVAPLADVDTGDDLSELARRLGPEPHLAPRTAHLLAGMGLA